ncbi:MAG TPA: hypothetical protein VEF53_11205 [Patescibacteria group bacterium]|nr:hypothetical protein [Patescibacteria group bacterium]
MATHPLKTVYIFSSRLTMWPEEEERPKEGGCVAYAWFVWEKGYMGLPVIKWITDKDDKK